MTSRATFELRDKDILTILSYLNTPVDLPGCYHSMALPFLKSADPMKLGDQDVVKAAMAARRESCFKFPLRLEATSHFATLWCTVRPPHFF